MKLKTILLVVAVLAVLSVASLVLNKKTPPADEADPRVHQPLIAADVVNQATGLRLTDNGKTVLLKKSGDAWRVSSYHDLPADFSKLARFVQDLANAKVDRFVTSNPKRLEGLELKDTKVALLDASDHALAEITLGKNAEGGGRFLRFGDEAKAYLASSVTTWLDLEPKNWVNSELTRFGADDVKTVSMSFPGASPVEFGRAKKGESFATEKLPVGKQIKASAISSLLGGLGALRFTDTIDAGDPKAEATRAHFRTAVVTTFAGKVFTIGIGREPEHDVVTAPEPKPANGGPEAVVGPVAGNDNGAAAKDGPVAVVGGPITKKIPAGPVFVTVTTSDAGDAVNAIMKKRACEAEDYVLTGLPATPDDFFEPVPKPEAAKAEMKTANP